VKYLVVSFVLFTANVLLSAPVRADDLKLYQGQFSIRATLKNTATIPPTLTPLFNLSGSAFWVKDETSNISDTAEITLRRTTYKCDEVYSYTTKYRCEVEAPNFQKMLSELSTHDANFEVAKDVVRRYYEDGYYYDTFSILLGKMNQTDEQGEVTQLKDPANKDLSVEFEIKNTGMHDL